MSSISDDIDRLIEHVDDERNRSRVMWGLEADTETIKALVLAKMWHEEAMKHNSSPWPSGG